MIILLLLPPKAANSLPLTMQEFQMAEIIHSHNFFLTLRNLFSMVSFREAKDRTILPFDAPEPHLPKDRNSFATRSSELSFA